MSDPIPFESTSPRFALPLLFSGQAEKEVFVNEGFAIADALLHCSIEGEARLPPPAPSDGENWLVSAAGAAEWAGQDHALACRQGGNWIFVQPRDGLRVFDRSLRQDRFFHGTWRKALPPMEPLGGITVDAEARAAIADLIAMLRVVGIFPSV